METSKIIQPDAADAVDTAGRRSFLGKAALSGTAVALLAGCESLSRGNMFGAGTAADVKTLNFALGLEHEAIGIYQIAAGSGLIRGRVLQTAVLFQGHHKAHRDALAATIGKLGGKPVAAKSEAFYKQRIAKYPLRNQRDVLELAYKLEGIAANEYIKAIPSFRDTALAKVAGRLVADEVMHWTTYAAVLGKPLPKAGLTFTG